MSESLHLLEQNFTRMATELMPYGWHSILCNQDGSVFAHATSLAKTSTHWFSANAALVGYMPPGTVDWTKWQITAPPTDVRKYEPKPVPLTNLIPHFIFMADLRMPEGWWAILADENGDVWAYKSEAWRANDGTWESDRAYYPVGSVPSEMIDWLTWKITPENRNN